MGSMRRQEKTAFTASDGNVAIAVMRSGSDYHSGLFFINEDDEARALHLAFHSKLCLDRLETEWQISWWAVPEILPERAGAIAALCNLVWKKNGPNGLPYALKYLEGSFNIGTGEIQLGPGLNGFTCSTFVMALFRSSKVQLLEQDQWKQRVDDVERQKRLVCLLKRKQKQGECSEEHVKAVESEIGCVRFSPLDIQAAAVSDRLPIGFNDAETIGAKLAREMEGEGSEATATELHS
jgi:hypothetical protein